MVVAATGTLGFRSRGSFLSTVPHSSSVISNRCPHTASFLLVRIHRGSENRMRGIFGQTEWLPCHYQSHTYHERNSPIRRNSVLGSRGIPTRKTLRSRPRGPAMLPVVIAQQRLNLGYSRIIKPLSPSRPSSPWMQYRDHRNLRLSDKCPHQGLSSANACVVAPCRMLKADAKVLMENRSWLRGHV